MLPGETLQNAAEQLRERFSGTAIEMLCAFYRGQFLNMFSGSCQKS